MMKRKIAIANLMTVVLLTMLLNGMKINALGDEISSNIVEMQLSEEKYIEKDIPILENIGVVSIKQSIKVGNQTVYMYATFDNSVEAMNNIKEEASDILQIIADEYGFEPLNENNWMDYYDTITKQNFCNEQLSKEVGKLKAFFDIYENKNKNDEIIDYITLNKNRSNIADISLMLPYDENIMEVNTARSGNYNVTDAINYAVQYATERNISQYPSFGSDCTNFVSQILENAGVSQEEYDSEYSGWWHRIDWILGVPVHKQSRSWSVADVFCRYMGVGYKTTSHFDFSVQIREGDFIAEDNANDGDWNHTAFVTQSDNYLTDGYYDYMVAQHGSDYLAWTSSDVNNWDLIEEQGGAYGRIRR